MTELERIMFDIDRRLTKIETTQMLLMKISATIALTAVGAAVGHFIG